MDVFEAPSMGRKWNGALIRRRAHSWGVAHSLGVLALGEAVDTNFDLRCCFCFFVFCSWATPACLNVGGAVPGLLGRLLAFGEEGVGARLQAGRYHCFRWGMEVQSGVPPLSSTLGL